MHKECWEPVIEMLFATMDAQKSGTQIREIWCIDAPNHGEGAVLNEEFLRTHWLEECEYRAFAVTQGTKYSRYSPLG